MGVLVVTGTGHGVGATVVTAALAGRFAARRGHRVAVVKPVQVGAGPGAAADLAEITRLSGVTSTFEYARYAERLPPHHAAAVSGRPELDLAEVVRRVVDLEASYDTVLVDGAGGLLVPFTGDFRWTLADLAATLRAPALVVTTVAAGAPDHAALTVGRLAEDGIANAGVVIGRWPEQPGLAERRAVADLAALAPDGRLAGVLPAGIAAAPNFRQRARAALSSRFGGTFDAVAFAAEHRAAR